MECGVNKFVSCYIGWFLVWKFFLSRFKFVRELLGTVSDNIPEPGAEGTKPLRARNRKARLE